MDSLGTDFNKEFIVRVDAWSYAAGYALFQLLDDIERPIAFGGKTFSALEKAYAPGQQELYAIFLACRAFRKYIFGPVIRLYTDHQAGVDNKFADALCRLWGGKDMLLLDGSKWSLDSKRDIIKQSHEGSHGCHNGIKGTYEKVAIRCQWPGLYKQVREFCKQCITCLENDQLKGHRNEMTGILADKPWSIVGIDIVGPLFSSEHNQKQWVMIIVDYFSNMIEGFPLMSANGAKLLISDGGSNLTGEEVTDMCNKYGIVQRNSSVGHQQANGEVER